jgi:OOP family OmpA-OmpF porin
MPRVVAWLCVGVLASTGGCGKTRQIGRPSEPVLVIVGHPPPLPAVPEPPPPPPPPPPPKVALGEAEIELREPVGWLERTARLDPPQSLVLEELAQLLGDNPRIEKISIEVHTDGEGSRATNKKLAAARATAVRDYLVARGVDPKRLGTKAWGEERPLGDDATPEGRAQNQRIELPILRQAAAPAPEESPP